MVLSEDILNKPILARRGAAGLKLGDSVELVYKLLGKAAEKNEIRQGMFKLNYKEVVLWLDGGKVDQIGLYSGYLGKTDDGVGIGITKENLKNIWGLDLAYHEDDEYWEFISKPGTLFNFEKNKEGKEVVSEIYLTSSED